MRSSQKFLFKFLEKLRISSLYNGYFIFTETIQKALCKTLLYAGKKKQDALDGDRRSIKKQLL